jgi:uncharacterized membrane protein (UPF0136 family)
MTSTLVLWIYVGLLVLGGLIGYLKAKSKASLIMSLAFATPIALVALGVLRIFYHREEVVNGVTRVHIHFDLADLLIAILLIFFGIKFIKGKKFMPAGLMCLASIVALVLRLFILH